MQQARDNKVRQAVREAYGKVAEAGTAGCGCACDCAPSVEGDSTRERENVPVGADMGLSSGDPLAVADLQPGETVLDLGSGAGVDCFFAANQVGDTGHVIGVDMTPEMVAKASEIAVEGGYTNVEFRLGEIENLPVADKSVDVILSNCVVNLSPDKPGTYREAYRVLKPGGRLAISDVVTTAELPNEVRGDLALHAACIAGAASIAELREILHDTGFESVRIQPQDKIRDFILEWSPGRPLEDYLVATTIEAVRPATRSTTR
jgi:SAM-dependent methyltransferase